MKKPNQTSFYNFYRKVCGHFQFNWWHEELSDFLSEFNSRFEERKRPMAVVSSPPQHGKSTAVVSYVAWFLGRNPGAKVLYLSANEALCRRATKELTNILMTPHYIRNFGEVVKDGERLTQRGIPLKHGGSFKACSLNATFIGETADLVVVDDPYKDRAEAHSLRIRTRRQLSFYCDVMTRLQDRSGVLVVATRWHENDLSAEVLKTGENVMEFCYPAIAVVDEKHRKKGEALNPAWKSLEFLDTVRRMIPRGEWQSVYQQNPGHFEDSVFERRWFVMDDRPMEKEDVEKLFIVADTAQKTGEHNDYSVFQLWGKKKGEMYLLDMKRAKWDAPTLYNEFLSFLVAHPEARAYVEDKVSGTGLIQSINQHFGFPKVFGRKRHKDKVSRCYSVAHFVASGRVHLPRHHPVTEDFLEEIVSFNVMMTHKHDDMVDTMVDALEIGLLEDKSEDFTYDRWLK